MEELLSKPDFDVDISEALWYASFSGCKEGVNLLLKWGAQANRYNDWEDEYTLQVAAKKGHCDVVKVLIRECAKIRGHEERLLHALVSACKEGHEDIVDLLLA
ncbi:hypothetical protein DM02DRAFT_573327, partial [Periconia macrospinosa]